jgi:hypothetical protein
VVSAKQENFIKSEYEMRLIIVVVQVGAVKICIAAEEALRKKERGDETQFTTKIGGKTSLGPSYFIRKIPFPVTHLTAYYVETGHFHPLIS